MSKDRLDKSVSCLHCHHLNDLTCKNRGIYGPVKFDDELDAAKYRCCFYEFKPFLPIGYIIKDHRICCVCAHWDGSFCEVTRHKIKVFGCCDNFIEDVDEETRVIKSLDELEEE
jgi:hypothetical protein